MHQCDQCPKIFKNAAKLERHHRSHTGERPYACQHPGCDKRYGRSEHLAVHALSHLDNQEERRPFKCTYQDCTRSFPTNCHLKRHYQTHEKPKPYECSFEGCSEAFSKHHQLRKHMTVHTGQNPFICEHKDCTKSFKTSSQLKSHMHTHSDRLRYRCGIDDCESEFRRYVDLQAHLRDDHPVVCPICNRAFAQRKVLAAHMLVHERTREKFKCTWADCDREYVTEKSRDTHVKAAHERLKEFKCPVDGCGRLFSRRETLARHQKRHALESASGQLTPKKRRSDYTGPGSFREELTGHHMVKHPRRTIACYAQDCLLKFSRYYDLQRHILAAHPEWDGLDGKSHIPDEQDEDDYDDASEFGLDRDGRTDEFSDCTSENLDEGEEDDYFGVNMAWDESIIWPEHKGWHRRSSQSKTSETPLS
ncbi:uncharacterized protein BJ171DRAFT_55520 [Polychytrium aggregatum]|uniref:uncharacterized protein n=1 Tax=Polychytrium aggregatum TaxID=110093 RepID=UPI0022FEBE33|nr:uncharacterized protein BJ171DRAFT_55520 [Polychytrium aggregatum]KAI9205954.1 hypothetical protein BJ171DRAFT_55520 [Polychytrium aggregatum]